MQKKPEAPLSEDRKKMLFALLALAALAASAYVFLFSPKQDLPSDGREFYFLLQNSGKAAFLYDVRGAEGDQASAIYQCGVDIISKGRLAGKELTNIGCDENGCLASRPESNRTAKMSYEQALAEISSQPYILIKAGSPGYQFFQRHMEIRIGKEASEGVSCDISAVES
ncbi:MAG: hypothetical protein N3F07_00185 [Candidatus Micrarchaeota archaeon]|nr:hypothetical protein [Candidatus Micrarchaeota archaeon]